MVAIPGRMALITSTSGSALFSSISKKASSSSSAAADYQLASPLRKPMTRRFKYTGQGGFGANVTRVLQQKPHSKVQQAASGLCSQTSSAIFRLDGRFNRSWPSSADYLTRIQVSDLQMIPASTHPLSSRAFAPVIERYPL